MSKYRVVTDQGAYEVTTDEPDSLGATIGQAAKDVFTKPAAAISDLATNPETMANAMPAVLGTAGAVAPVPGGATMGTAAGQGIRDLALKTLNKPVPSVGQHALELGGAAVGDVAAIPGIKAKIFGGQIGDAEKAAGVVTRAPLKLPTAGNVGTALDELEGTLKQSLSSGVPLGPQSARDAYAVANYVAGNPNIVGKSNEIAVQAARVRSMAQAAMNQAIEGRGAPAAAYASSQTIPNAIGSVAQGVKKLPIWAQAAGGTAASILGLDALKHALGGGR